MSFLDIFGFLAFVASDDSAQELDVSFDVTHSVFDSESVLDTVRIPNKVNIEILQNRRLRVDCKV